MLLTLLRSKNKCLEKYFSLSRAFLDEVREGHLAGLTEFQDERDDLLRAMELFDKKVNELVEKFDAADRTKILISQVEDTLARKDHLVKEILDVDLKIISMIEVAKQNIMNDIKQSRRSKESVSRFKSEKTDSVGRALDEKL